MQWLVVNTLFQEKTEHHNRNDGSKETSKLDPLLEVTTSHLRSELRLLNRDKTHSWVRISHGSNKFVINLNNNETQNS